MDIKLLWIYKAVFSIQRHYTTAQGSLDSCKQQSYRAALNIKLYFALSSSASKEGLKKLFGVRLKSGWPGL